MHQTFRRESYKKGQKNRVKRVLYIGTEVVITKEA